MLLLQDLRFSILKDWKHCDYWDAIESLLGRGNCGFASQKKCLGEDLKSFWSTDLGTLFWDLISGSIRNSTLLQERLFSWCLHPAWNHWTSGKEEAFSYMTPADAKGYEKKAATYKTQLGGY
ncbi:unnamed protein product [Caretta caretta]